MHALADRFIIQKAFSCRTQSSRATRRCFCLCVLFKCCWFPSVFPFTVSPSQFQTTPPT